MQKERQGRQEYVYKYNLFDHIGAVSTFSVRPERAAFPRCFGEMASVWTLPKHETFRRRVCRSSDVSPCRAEPGARDDLPLGQWGANTYVLMPSLANATVAAIPVEALGETK